jgi:hypothetical protein
MVPHH